MEMISWLLLPLWLLTWTATPSSTAPLPPTNNGNPSPLPQPVDLLVSHRASEPQRLFGSFSTAGESYETEGDVVQVSPYRACEVKRMGYDKTQAEAISVVFFDELEPFVVGCVSLDNQIRFAQKSNAIALIVGPSNRVVHQKEKLFLGSAIPVVILDEVETQRFRKQLEAASQVGSIVHVALQTVHFRPAPTVLRLQVFRPTLLNIGLIVLLLLLIVFISGLVIIKIRWRPQSSHDLWLRTLARSALNKMEVRKFEKVNGNGPNSNGPGERRRFLIRPARYYKPVFGSLISVAHSSSNQERCSICLEEYKQGEELRVLFCGHEFHPKCVDPWLIPNRRCPLCQYDVVYKEYPCPDSPTKRPSLSLLADSTALEDSAMQTDPVMFEGRHFCEIDPRLPGVNCRQSAPRRSIRARSAGSRRRPLRPRQEPIGTISGYSSDGSSFPDENTRQTTSSTSSSSNAHQQQRLLLRFPIVSERFPIVSERQPQQISFEAAK